MPDVGCLPISSLQVRIFILLWSADGQHEHQIAHSGYRNAIVCPSHIQPLCINITACVLQKPRYFIYKMKIVWKHEVQFRCLSIVSIWAILACPVWTLLPLQRGTGLQWVTSVWPMRTSQLPNGTSSGRKSCLNIVFRKPNHAHGYHWWYCKTYSQVCTSAADVREQFYYY